MVGSYDAERGIREAQNQAGAIAGRMGSVADQVKEQVKGRISDAADTASGALTSVREQGSIAAGNAGEVMGALREALAKSAREQPGTTVLLSVAAGFLLGAIWRSGR
jgi:hypothetical protein